MEIEKWKMIIAKSEAAGDVTHALRWPFILHFTFLIPHFSFCKSSNQSVVRHTANYG